MVKKFTAYLLTFAAALMLFGSPSLEGRERGSNPLKLTSISIIDRNGMNETIQTEERLQQYAKQDFLKPQPYQKVLRTYSRNNKGEVLSLITSYYPNGQIKQYMELINKGAYGPYWEWHEGGQPKLYAFIIGGMGDLGPSSEKTWLFDGTAKSWNEEGRLVCEIPYNKGVINGTSKYYHSKGYLQKSVPLSDGKIHGLVEKFGPKGEVVESISYVEGKRAGKTTILYPGGLKAAEEEYKDGLLLTGDYFSQAGEKIASVRDLEGKQAVFEEGRLVEVREIRDGIPSGEVLQYDNEGVLFIRYRTKDGLKHGEEIEYYPARKGKELRPRISLAWYKGKIQGVVKTWYENGRQESQREMSDNRKNGVLTAWYEDGSLMLIEEYDLDLLKKGSYFKIGDKTPVSFVRDGQGIATFFDSHGSYLRKIHYNQGRPKE
ncbi:toxin-antitoxin system YwqK family antitoxin [Estrella lausannensis]|uniref:Conserved putative secreted protein n=1 Tax=Estrella lausannensis TaxID=483423 RepID=A0A0H5DNW2_9BACT|nr:hypothetical protein [Estrella lausannensis]CRX37543.1 Conserved putative secreted protein [Estrella lausannensis]